MAPLRVALRCATRSICASDPRDNHGPESSPSRCIAGELLEVDRPFEAPHNATTIRDRFSIPDANIGRSVWAVMRHWLGAESRVTALAL
jgi:hypothetical protein